MDDIKAKKDIIEKIQSSSNILITVSNDPSVDELSAALGLTLALNKIEKYATAIYSGKTPQAIAFLEPEKTFEENTDSLRDFIIALNKEKADHLRFKPDGEYVKIFITPYRSIIKPEDLEFSQGDFNVELVIALGVDTKEHLDDALDNHGQILHDATVVTITTGDMQSKLGSINWSSAQVSSLSEMAAGLVEALKADKKESILDGAIATALLTGIVAETDRFSNAHTTSHVMTVASSLMNAGADQQLISTELQKTAEVQAIPVTDGSDISSDTPEESSVSSTPEDSAYTLTIDREEPEETLESEEVVQEEPAVEVEEAPVPELTPGIEPVEETVVESSPTSVYSAEPIAEPAPILEGSDGLLGEPQIAPGSVAVNETPGEDDNLHSAYAFDDPAQPQPLVEEPAESELKHEKVIQPLPSAMEPQAPVDLGLPMPPPLPDFSVGVPPAIPVPNAPQPEILGDILTPDVAPQSAYAAPPIAAPQPVPAPQPVAPAPGQFQIPGQPQ